MKNAQQLFVISAPSGAGKTTLVKSLINRNSKIKYSISYTTRTPRINEVHGRDYFFINNEEFNRLKSNNEFIEHAKVFDNYYATSKKQIEAILNNGCNAILEIDWQGAMQVRKSIPTCTSIFIMPPSKAALYERLINRGTDTKVTIKQRINESERDMSHWSEFNYCIINDDLELASKELELIFSSSSKLNCTKNPKLIKKINKILCS